jgi:hypothetical protein
MQEVWKRSGHILPAIAFEKTYWGTILLPLKTERARLDVERLRRIMSLKPRATQAQLLGIAASEYGLTRGRTRTVLHMRRGLEWGWDFSVLDDSSVRRLIPNEISVEYLVAELERHGVELRLQEGRALQARTP